MMEGITPPANKGCGPSTAKEPRVTNFPEKIVDMKLLTDLQNELKYQLHSTWKQLNLLQSKDGTLEARRYSKMTIEEYTSEKVKSKSPRLRCCTLCYCHLPEADIIEHMKKSHSLTNVKEFHSVPVLVMDRATSRSRVSVDVIRKLESQEYHLVCTICRCSFQMGRNNMAATMDQHCSSTYHVVAVKKYLSYTKDTNIHSAFLMLRPYPKSASKPADPDEGLKYHPHEFLPSCCCRNVDCEICDTPPYIFAHIVPPEAGAIRCKVCEGSFQTKHNKHYQSIVDHIKTQKHLQNCAKQLRNKGYLPDDTKTFWVSQTHLKDTIILSENSVIEKEGKKREIEEMRAKKEIHKDKAAKLAGNPPKRKEFLTEEDRWEIRKLKNIRKAKKADENTGLDVSSSSFLLAESSSNLTEKTTETETQPEASDQSAGVHSEEKANDLNATPVAPAPDHQASAPRENKPRSEAYKARKKERDKSKRKARRREAAIARSNSN